MSKVAIIGASIAGLVAAVKLKRLGLDVTIFEKGQSIGGLFSNTETPFGTCELGMHVIYVTDEQHKLLSDIFGEDNFIEKSGVHTDIGGCFNHQLFPDSIYPDLRWHPSIKLVMEELFNPIPSKSAQNDTINCLSALKQRFGPTAANITSPIIEKLWKSPADTLSTDAIHCYFDLRRLIIADKPQADLIKSDPRLNNLVANPLQLQPAGEVFNGRKALFFKKNPSLSKEEATQNILNLGIELILDSNVKICNSDLYNGSELIFEHFNACIIATPLHSINQRLTEHLDNIELSIFYFKVDRTHCDHIEDYYIVCHDPELLSTRIVNYSAYNFEKLKHLDEVIAVEVVHPCNHKPDINIISNELKLVINGISIIDSYEFPYSLKVPTPSLTNADLLDRETSSIIENFKETPVFFAGMRTDKGVFFSHHTIGAAYDAALECASALS